MQGVRVMSAPWCPKLVITFLLWFGSLGVHCNAQRNYSSQPLLVCTVAKEPMVTCNTEQDPREYSGFDIEKFRQVAKHMGWKEGINYTFACIPEGFGVMMKDLFDTADGICHLATAGITLSSERVDMGLKFTYPTLRVQLAAIVKANLRSRSRWDFLRPLDWNVWVAVIATSVGVPAFLIILESLATHGFILKEDWIAGLKEALWDSSIVLLHFGQIDVQSTAARVLSLSYGFLVLIIIQSYVANLAAFLTLEGIESGVESIGDLRGRTVGTIPTYTERLRRNGLFATELPFTDTMEKRAQRILSGPLDAIITDWPIVEFLAGTNCNLKQIPERIEPFDYAVAFPATAPDDIIDSMSESIQQLNQDGAIEKLADEHILVENSLCAHEKADETSSIRMTQIWGLWIVLGFCIGAAAFLLIISMINRRFKIMRFRSSDIANMDEMSKKTCPEHESPGATVSELRFQMCAKRVRWVPTRYHPRTSARFDATDAILVQELQKITSQLKYFSETLENFEFSLNHMKRKLERKRKKKLLTANIGMTPSSINELPVANHGKS